jgi:hypothetical protein
MRYRPANYLHPAPHKFTPRHPAYLRSALILFSHPRLTLQSSLYSARVLPNRVRFTLSALRTMCPLHFTAFDLPIRIIFGVYTVPYSLTAVYSTVQSYCCIQYRTVLLLYTVPYSLTAVYSTGGTYSDHCAVHIVTTGGIYSDHCAVHIVTTVRYI